MKRDPSVCDLAQAIRRRTPIVTPKVALGFLGGVIAAAIACGYSAYRIERNDADFRDLQRAQLQAIASQKLHTGWQNLHKPLSAINALSALLQLDAGVNLMQPLNIEVASLYQRATAMLVDPTSEAKQAAEDAKRIAVDSILVNASRLSFGAVAQSLILTYPAVTSLNLEFGGVVSIVHPMEGNEAKVGIDLLTDPSYRRDAYSTLRSGTTMFTGPLRYGDGLERVMLARMPIFISKPDWRGPRSEFPSLWGFVSMTCALDELVGHVVRASTDYDSFDYVMYAYTDSGAALLQASDGVPIAANGEAGQDAALLEHARGRSPVRVELNEPDLNLHWAIMLWPRDGWRVHSDMFWGLCIFTVICSLISVYIVLVRESAIYEVNRILRAPRIRTSRGGQLEIDPLRVTKNMSSQSVFHI